jgi:NADH-quinone oxidoreductase subunit L
MSQLGLMFLGVGCGAFGAAMFHLVMHSIFQSLLFLSAGAVVLALRHESDLFGMGALRKRLPKTRVVVLVGVLALTGAPPLSGFFSQGQIALGAFSNELPGHSALYWMATLTALLTSFYMLRLYFLVFSGESHVEREVRAHLQEPGNLTLVPLYALAVLSVLAGALLGLPQFWGDMIAIDDSDSLGNFLRSVLVTSAAGVSTGKQWGLVTAAVAAWALGALAAWWLYVRKPALAARASESVASLAALLRNGFFIDRLYDRVLIGPLVALSERVLHRGVDAGLIDGLVVNGVPRSLRAFANNALKRPQSGMTQGYLVAMVAGMLGILLYLVR